MLPTAQIQIPFLAITLDTLRQSFISSVIDPLLEPREIKQKELDQAFYDLHFAIGFQEAKEHIDQLIPTVTVRNIDVAKRYCF